MIHVDHKQKYTFVNAFEADEVINQFGCSALGLFVLNHLIEIEDITEFAINNIIEGGGDKKIDICYFSEESGHVIVVQDYLSPNWNKLSAPEKVTDLNTAIAWLLTTSEVDIPEKIKPKATEIRRALSEGRISHFEILYIHNCPESDNVRGELKTVADLLKSVLLTYGQENIEITCKELGLNAIETLYKSIDSQIVIDDWLDIPLSTSYISESTDNWESILTSVPASWIRDLYLKHGDNLFSANYRGFLGSNKKAENINSQIINTANVEPENFWVYNNGITAITHKIDFDGKNNKIMGISIINGAQTSGALGSANPKGTDQAKVILRIISCYSTELINNIIQYNNTQNEIKPEDRRSKDDRQSRIQSDFSKFGLDYYYRRTKKKISRNTITSKSIAPALCSFHVSPEISYRNPTKIFKDDETYEKVFPIDITIEHIFLLRSLSMAIDEIKKELVIEVENEKAKESDRKQSQFLKYSATKHFLIEIVSVLSEEVLGSKITNKYNWCCLMELISPENKSLIKAWKKVIRAILPLLISILDKRGDNAYYEVPRSIKLTREVEAELKPIIIALEPNFREIFNDIRKRTKLI